MGALAVIWAPVSALSRVAGERRTLLGFGVTALYAALGVVAAALAVFGGARQAQFGSRGQPLPPGVEDLLPLFGVLAVVFAAVSPFVFWLLVSGLMQLVTRFFGGTGPFSGMLAAVGVAQVPLVIAAVLQVPITGVQIVLDPESPATAAVTLLGSLLNIAALLWFVVLVVIGAAFARRVGYGESAGSCAISCAGCLTLIILVVVALVAVAAIVGEASGGTS